MRSPRSVTQQPMGMPLRILKFAMDFFARVKTAFWPAIWPELDHRHVQQLAVLARFTQPDIHHDLLELGDRHRIRHVEALHQRRDDLGAIPFSHSTGHDSVPYLLFLSCAANRRMAGSSILFELLFERCAATPANAYRAAVRALAPAHPRMLVARGANQQYV